MTANTREIISHFNQSQGEQNKRFDERFAAMDVRFAAIEHRLDGMDAKIDAIMEMLATRKELVSLVRALKAKGIELEESEIFTI